MPVALLGLTAFVWLLGVALIWPVLPFQALGFGASPLVVTLLFATDTAVAMLAAPLLGRLSDRLGRRPTMIVGLLVGAVGYLMLAFAGSLAELFLARVLGGLSLAALPALQAALADATTEGRRIRGFATFNGAYAAAFVVGPLATWQALELLGAAPMTIGLMAAAVTLSAAILLGPARDREPAFAESAEAAGASAGWRGYLMAGFLVPISAVVLLGIAHSGWDAILAVWSEHKLRWTADEVAIAYAVTGGCAAISQFFLLPMIAERRGESAVALLAAVGCASALALLAVSRGGPATFLALGLFGAAIATANSCLFTRLTREVPSNRQGAVLGVADSLLSMAWLLGPLVAGLAYSEHWTGLPFLLGALLAALATGLLALRPPVPAAGPSAAVQER